MCGRYAMTTSVADLSALFGAEDGIGSAQPPRYNIAPTQPVVVVRGAPDTGGRLLSLARWGLVPPWGGRRGGRLPRLINARAETVATSPAFATAFATRRCVVPASGWYEWARIDARRKRPYFLTAANGDVLGFAGIWALGHPADARTLTCGIVTTAATGALASVHDRMPLLLSRARWAEWLDPGELGAGESNGVLRPPEEPDLTGIECRPVGADVGDVRNDGPELMRAVDPAPPGQPAGELPDLTLF
ncbi:MAG: SOS response-associated peptidase [Dactylosporangium sp.]|nr:SOS response-associated peptidase [Dactylosporangium sp.]NNJ62741.1 SOS response-associated peptidase [Dactylosporangium sp.]